MAPKCKTLIKTGECCSHGPFHVTPCKTLYKDEILGLVTILLLVGSCAASLWWVLS